VSGGATGRPPTDPSGTSGPSSHRRALGTEAEERAADWYEGHGYEVLDRNWRRREGEIDLIVRQGRTVVFCEVKTRTSNRFGTGAESVLEAKQRRIRRLAARWLAELTPAAGRDRVEVRFDVVSITADQLDVIEDAF
jgi:putative endonuclease